MNIILGTIGANLTLGLISGITAASNGIYTLVNNISESTASGALEVKNIIKESDVEVKIKSVRYFLCELKVNENTPKSVQYCIQSIDESIKEIVKELEQIHYRMQYNSNLWFGSTVRSFKFHNSRARLMSKLKNLESRFDMLKNVISMEHKLVKNPDLDINPNPNNNPKSSDAIISNISNISNTNDKELNTISDNSINNFDVNISDKLDYISKYLDK